MKWYLLALKKYATFSGRSRRSEYWYFFLFNVIFNIVALLIDNISGTTFVTGLGALPYGNLFLIYAVAMLVPSLAAVVRRLHDVGKSGWMYFIVLIPFAGPIWLLVLLASDSNPGMNKYGINPKQIAIP